MLKIILNKKISFLTGILLAFIFLYYFSYGNFEKKNFEELAIGEKAKATFGKIDDINIHCRDLRDIKQCLDDYKKFGSNLPIILWLGNSQLHVINQHSPGEETASVILHKLLKKKGYYLMTFSQPNANIQEHLILAAHLYQKLPVSDLILPVVFDDMREIKIRPDIEKSFNDKDTKSVLVKSTKNGLNLYNDYLNKKDYSNSKNNKSVSLQENSEKLINDNLKKNWFLWSERSNLRGEFIFSLYNLRNFIFQINPSSIRKMIPGRYKKNFNALKDIIEISKIRNINIFIYTVPIRNDVKIPYRVDEYTNFKDELEQVSKKNNIKYRNFENIVPNLLWGTKNSSSIDEQQKIDFMHFKAKGHKILANKIENELTHLIKK